MEFFMLLVVLFIVFLSTCIAIVTLCDADILTFLAVQFGRAASDAFRGKVVWITGASSGIGEALVKEIAASKNVKLVISARRGEELARVKNQCVSLHPIMEDDILVLPFDMTDTAVHQEAFDKVITKFGKAHQYYSTSSNSCGNVYSQLDVLVCNAGRSQRAVWHKIDMEVDKEIFDLNVFSVVNLSRKAVAYFLEVGGGQLAVTSSIAGKVGAPYSGSYTGSKHAIHGYFESLRNEVRQHNIHITILCPGPTFSSLLGPCLTDKPGRALEGKMRETDRRMTSKRCAFLSSVAIANRLEESWMGLFPIITFMYLQTYMPYLITSKIVGIMAKRNLFMKIRDSSEETVKKD